MRRLLLLFCCSSIFLSFQKDVFDDKTATYTFTGLVLENETLEPLIGVTIKIPGTTIGVISDVNGVFKIEIPNDTKQLELNYGCCFGCDPYLELCGHDMALVVIDYGRRRTTTQAFDETGRNSCHPRQLNRIPRRVARKAFGTIREAAKH